MKIRILQLIEGARQARGLTVIIDVFRAFSTACYVIGNGAERLLAAGNVKKAFLFREKDPGCILMGERDEVMVPGFDYGNSPSHIENADFAGKTVVHCTSSGTPGLISAVHADEIITGSFVNAGAVIRYIQSHSPEEVSLVCMGYAAERPIEEDTYFAEYIRNALQGLETDYESMVENIRQTSGARFFNPQSQEYAPSTDFYLCLHLDRFDFVLNAIRMDQGIMELKPVYPA